MDELLKKAKINEPGIKRLAARITAKNLNGLVEPCYIPPTKLHYFEFLKLTGLKDADVKEFTKRRWKGRKEERFETHRGPIANFYVFLMQYFLQKRDQVTFRNLVVFYLIRHYGALMRKHFPKWCNEEFFKYALDQLTKTHLFAREKTIGNALYYLATELIKRWSRGLLENNLDDVALFMTYARSRVSQSVKTFANTYYKASTAGTGIMAKPDEDDENAYQFADQTERGTKLIDDTVRKITVYRFSDQKAKEEARKVTKINSSVSTLIINGLNKTQYSDKMRVIYKLFIKGIKDKSYLCGKNYYTYVRSMMSIKRTNQKIYFKQQINILLMEVLKDIKFKKNYDKFTSQTQFQINLFLAYYLTLLMRNPIC